MEMNYNLVAPQEDHGVGWRFMAQGNRCNRFQVKLYLVVGAAEC